MKKAIYTLVLVLAGGLISPLSVFADSFSFTPSSGAIDTVWSASCSYSNPDYMVVGFENDGSVAINWPQPCDSNNGDQIQDDFVSTSGHLYAMVFDNNIGRTCTDYSSCSSDPAFVADLGSIFTFGGGDSGDTMFTIGSSTAAYGVFLAGMSTSFGLIIAIVLGVAAALLLVGFAYRKFKNHALGRKW